MGYPQLPLIDADILAYRSSCMVKEDEPLAHALHNAKLQMEAIVDAFDRGLEQQSFLTGTGNYRHEIATIQPYKGNRTQPKPFYLPQVREYLQYAWGAKVVDGIEADDAVSCIQYAAKDKSTCIVTIDKDLDGTPGWHYNPVKKEHYYVTLDEANYFFYKQVLTGDRTDNIRGVRNLGPKKASKILEGLTSTIDLYRACQKEYLREYGADGQRQLVETANLLYILRKEGERWSPPQ